MDDTEAWAVIERERLALADLLDTLSPQQWAAASLCTGWSVREVSAHLMVGPSGSMGEFLGAWVRSGLSFDGANQRLAVRHAAAPTAQIVANLRAHADDRFTPPTFDWHAPLSDLRLHTLDICVPLGLDVGQPVAPWADVLDFLVSAKARRGFVARDRPDLAFAASDVEWRHGPADADAVAWSGGVAGAGPGRTRRRRHGSRRRRGGRADRVGPDALTSLVGRDIPVGLVRRARYSGRHNSRGADRFRLGTLVPGEAGRGANVIS